MRENKDDFYFRRLKGRFFGGGDINTGKIRLESEEEHENFRTTSTKVVR